MQSGISNQPRIRLSNAGNANKITAATVLLTALVPAFLMASASFDPIALKKSK